MNLPEILKIGESFEIRLGPVSARTKLEDMIDEKTFTIIQPTYKMAPLRFAENEEAMFVYLRENGIFSFKAKFLGKKRKQNLPLYYFEATTHPQKNQRRYAYRYATVLDAAIKMKDSEKEHSFIETDIKTINISENGMLFRSSKEIPIGTDLFIELRLNGKNAIKTNAKIIRVEYPTEKYGRYAIAVKFIEMDRKDRESIAKFVLNRQIHDRKFMQTNQDTDQRFSRRK